MNLVLDCKIPLVLVCIKTKLSAPVLITFENNILKLQWRGRMSMNSGLNLHLFLTQIVWCTALRRFFIKSPLVFYENINSRKVHNNICVCTIFLCFKVCFCAPSYSKTSFLVHKQVSLWWMQDWRQVLRGTTAERCVMAQPQAPLPR